MNSDEEEVALVGRGEYRRITGLPPMTLVKTTVVFLRYHENNIIEVNNESFALVLLEPSGKGKTIKGLRPEEDERNKTVLSKLLERAAKIFCPQVQVQVFMLVEN